MEKVLGVSLFSEFYVYNVALIVIGF